MPDDPAAVPDPGSVSVIVTVLDDPRLERTLDSLAGQRRPPVEVLIDDGGDFPTIRAICDRFAARDPRFRRLAAPGTIAESRNVALAVARGEFIAFLDTDEVAPPDWLARLLEPFSDPTVGFVGGPTPAIPGTCHGPVAKYYDAYLRRFYDRVAQRYPHALPMGNSAWRARALRQVGGLDLSLAGIGNEDLELALRTVRAGWKGRYVPTAPVGHDFSDVSARSLFRKQRLYSRGGYVIWRRYGATYEATPTRVLPFAVLPAVAVVGLVLLPFPAIRWLGAALVGVGLLGLALLAVGLWVQGVREDARYPGYRYRAVEIWRRWATILGAFEGWTLGTRRAGPSAAPTRAPDRSLAGKP